MLSIAQALSKSRGLAFAKSRVEKLISDLTEQADRQPQGVLLVIDELGKFLEASAQEGGDDVYFFQELAEAASRAQGKLVVVGVLHQAFETYATRLGSPVRDDWAKVQGRFVDIPLISAPDETLELIGRAITVTGGVPSHPIEALANEIAKSIRARRPGAPPSIGAGLAKCWPLHPVTASLLGVISKRRFGQNERSVFGFLASKEPLGFSEFLEEPGGLSWQRMFGPSQYWDYLRANLEPSILASPDGHRWSVACDALERAEEKGTSLHISLTKAVALIEMFRNGTGLAAEERILCLCVSGSTNNEARKALRNLVSWKVLIERKHLGAFGIFAGSDFDIEGALSQARTQIGVADLAHLSVLTDLQPILAKRAYHLKGTMRWFTRRIARLSDLAETVHSFKRDPGSIGSFVLCLPPQDTLLPSAERIIRQISASTQNRGILVGIPINSERIADLSLELQAAESVLRTHPALDGDAVARKELSARIGAVRCELEEQLSDAFERSKWYCTGALQADSKPVLASLASRLAEEIYPECPHIFNELVNREEPSSNSIKARNDLLHRMVSSADKPKLGYVGFSADASLYYTILEASGLHHSTSNDLWEFGPPDDRPMGQSIKPLWNATRSLVTGSGSGTSLAEVFDLWAEPPFGVRAGLMPILAVAFFLAHRHELALYLDELFTPEISPATIDEWLLDIKAVTFRFIGASKDQGTLLTTIAHELFTHTQREVNAAPLDAARALVRLVLELPHWTRRTTTVSLVAQDVRAMLLKANDPYKVLFADLPSLLGVSEPKALAARLRAVIKELTRAYPNMLEHCKTTLLTMLDHRNEEVIPLRERAATVKGITGDLQLDAFAARLEHYDGTDSKMEGLMSLASGKPCSQWTDQDIDAAILKLSDWTVQFRKTEAMAPLRGRPATRRVIGIVFGSSAGDDVSDVVDVAKVDSGRINRIVQIMLSATKNERREVVLAALAEAGVLLVRRKQKESSK